VSGRPFVARFTESQRPTRRIKHLDRSAAATTPALIFLGSIALSYAALKLYDEPARKWLRKKLG